MIRAIIVEDVPRSQETLFKMLIQNCPQVSILGMANSVDTAYDLIVQSQPNLILLDIEMPQKNGFDLLIKFPNPDFEVIFTTAHDQYALRAIKFCALDYLLKPIDIQELQLAIQKTEQKLRSNITNQNFTHFLENLRNQNSQDHKIGLPTAEGLLFIKVSQILRCEAAGSYTNIFLRNKKQIIATRKVKEFENLLAEHDFFRIHRSHLINLNYIEKYYKGAGGYVTMSDGTSIDVARRKKEEFLDRLSRI